MTDKYNSYFQYIDRLIQSDSRFALYKLPNDSELHLVLQETNSDFTFQRFADIKGNGFIVAPFQVSGNYPIIQIKPEVVLSGVDTIFSYLSNLSFRSTNEVDETSTEVGTSKEGYESVFQKFHAKVEDRTFEKIVLSKVYSEERPTDLSIGKAFFEACEKYPHNYVYVCHTPISKTWMGATPELLLSRNQDTYKTVALAGTREASDDAPSWDSKNTEEQNIVAQYIENTLQKLDCSIQKSDTKTIKVGNLEHIKTEFSFENQSKISIGNLLDSLHPTPAICGLPKCEAYNFIIENETNDRRYYSGFLGNISDKDAYFFVNLRCVNILQHQILFFAGSGILGSSDADSEWNETEMKLDAMRAVIK